MTYSIFFLKSGINVNLLGLIEYQIKNFISSNQ